jgi:hypothetical protein
MNDNDRLTELELDQKYRRHAAIGHELNVLYKQKNTDYNDAFGKTVEKYGWIAALTRMHDKWNRIEQLLTCMTRQVKEESLNQTVRDMINYCLMTLIETGNVIYYPTKKNTLVMKSSVTI